MSQRAAGAGPRFDPERHHRRSIRLPGYDYAQAGAYFVTLCVRDRAWLFGEVTAGEMRLNDLGCIVEAEWRETLRIRPQVELGAYGVMPNHLHGILVIREGVPAGEGQVGGFRAPSQTIGAIVRGFKGATTRRINALRDSEGALVWQRDYYERIVRNEREWSAIAEYILNNPANWARDPENVGANGIRP